MKKDKRLLQALRVVQDPELHESIVDLGLIYGVVRSGTHVNVTMTLTTPFCPMSAHIQQGIEQTLLQLSEVESVTIELVWQPVWDVSTMASDEIKDKLGLW